MITNKQRDVVPRSSSPPRRTKRVDLSEFDGQRLAVILNNAGQRTVLRGTATYVRDEAVGSALNIELDNEEPGHPVLVISESEWNGRIIPDFHFGCRFSLVFE